MITKWVSVLAGRLPRRLVRLLRDLQFRSPRLQRAISASTTHLRTCDVVIAKGVGKGLRFNASGSNPGYALGTSEPEIQASLQEYVRPGDVLFDLGANAGFFTVLGARLVGPTGRVYAAEPLTEMAEAIRRNAALNGFAHVEVFELAIADRTGEETLVEGASSIDAHLGSLAGAGAHRTVRVTTVDALVEDHRVVAPTLVKLDIEGAEERALRGMTHTLLASRPIVLCELHHRDSRVPVLLQDLGYECRFIEAGAESNPDHWNPHILAVPGTMSNHSDSSI